MKKICVLLLFCILFLSACSSRPAEVQVWAYDTLCTATVWGGKDIASVFASSVREGEKLLSSTGEKQCIAAFAGDTYSISSDLYRILNQCGILYEKTGGVFDLTVAPLSNLWDVNSATQPPSGKEIEESLSLVGWDQLSYTEESVTFSCAGMGIDIGSVGKGYGADQTVSTLKKAGAEAGVVSFGGNVALFGRKNGQPFRIGVRDPEGTGEDYLGILTLTDTSVVTSGAYERCFEYTGTVYHHLLDANTGYPRESDLLSVTVVCSDGAQADLMSTALWLMGGDAGWALYESLLHTEGFSPAEVIFVYKDHSVRVSDGLSHNFELVAGGYTLG